MNDSLSRVYIKTDADNRISRIEGEYSLPPDLSTWTFLEEGLSCDKLNLAQTHYLDGELRTEQGIPRYKLVNGKAVERTQAEIDADIAAIPVPEPTPQEDTDALLADHEERLIYMELGV